MCLSPGLLERRQRPKSCYFLWKVKAHGREGEGKPEAGKDAMPLCVTLAMPEAAPHRTAGRRHSRLLGWHPARPETKEGDISVRARVSQLPLAQFTPRGVPQAPGSVPSKVDGEFCTVVLQLSPEVGVHLARRSPGREGEAAGGQGTSEGSAALDRRLVSPPQVLGGPPTPRRLSSRRRGLDGGNLGT